MAAYEVGPSPGTEEFAIGAVAELDVTSIGGYPVRFVQIVSGTGTLKYKDALTTAGNRTMTAAPGGELGPTQITSIRGTSDGTSGGLTVRVYK